MIVYKKTDEWYMEWHRMTTSDNEWQRMVQQMTTRDNEWHRVVQRMTISDTTSDNEWQRVVQQVTTNNSEWQRVTKNDNGWQRMTASDKTNEYEWNERNEYEWMKVCNIHRKTPVLESLFNKVASLEAYKLMKKRLQRRCFPVNIADFLSKFYLKNTTGGCFCTWNSPGIRLYKSGNWWNIFSIKYFMSLLCISSFFSLSVLLKLLKHVSLIIFDNYNECKTKHLFLIKKSSYTIW